MQDRREIIEGFSIDAFSSKNAQKWNQATRDSYKRSLCELKQFLDANGPPGKGTLQQWRDSLENQGYSTRSINLRISAANNYFRWCDRPDLVMHHQRTDSISQPPAMTRSEYLRLLCMARTLGKHRLYLLIKLFATTDLPLQCLNQVTTEAVRGGRSFFTFRGGTIEFLCPEGLQNELLEYARDCGIRSGPIFVTRGGQAVNRSNLCREMQELCRKAGVPEEKGNPRSLRHLYQATQNKIRSGLEQMLHQAYAQLLQAEQASAGWKEGA